MKGSIRSDRIRVFCNECVNQLIYGLGVSCKVAVLTTTLAVQAQVPQEVHARCIEAKDYEGCVNAQRSSRVNNQDLVSQDPYWYDEKSIRQLRVRGEYGRYLIFSGRTLFNAYEYSMINGMTSATAWSTGKSATGFGFTSSTAVGETMRSDAFTYHLDCRDATTDRIGDADYAQEDTAGWFPVVKDPTAQAVFSKYCPKILDLPIDGQK